MADSRGQPAVVSYGSTPVPERKDLRRRPRGLLAARGGTPRSHVASAARTSATGRCGAVPVDTPGWFPVATGLPSPQGRPRQWSPGLDPGEGLYDQETSQETPQGPADRPSPDPGPPPGRTPPPAAAPIRPATPSPTRRSCPSSSATAAGRSAPSPSPGRSWRKVDGLFGLVGINAETLQRRGLGEAKAASVIASLELARRLAHAEIPEARCP